jgi:hypothetical protein
MRLMLCLTLFPFAAIGGEFLRLEGDELLTPHEIAAMTRNRTITFYEGGTSQYSVGGAYSYSYAGGGTAFGRFKIGENGVICVTFQNGRARCDQFVHSHGRLVMISEQGDRFPIRP